MWLLSLFSSKNLAIAAIIFALSNFIYGQYEKMRYNAIVSEYAVFKAKNEELAKAINEKMADIQKTAAKEVIIERVVYKDIVQRIKDENDNRICFADSNAWSLYNASITGADNDRQEIATAPRETENTATVKAVLLNAAENYATCRENSIKHNALIDVVEKLNGNVCACVE